MSNLIPFSEPIIVDYLTTHLQKLIAIYAFGSRVKNYARLDSDIDLAILVAGYLDPLRCWNLGNQLSEQLNCEVDLVDLRATSTVMQYQIITTGKLLSPRILASDLFQCFILSEYTQFNTSRQLLLQRIIQEGRIYAR